MKKVKVTTGKGIQMYGELLGFVWAEKSYVTDYYGYRHSDKSNITLGIVALAGGHIGEFPLDEIKIEPEDR